MSNAGEFRVFGSSRLRVYVPTVSIAGPLEGPTFTVAPGWDGYTSTTTERPKPPAPEPSRQVRRAQARRAAKAGT